MSELHAIELVREAVRQELNVNNDLAGHGLAKYVQDQEALAIELVQQAVQKELNALNDTVVS